MSSHKRTLLLKFYELVDVFALFVCHFAAFFLANPALLAAKKSVLRQSVRMSELVPAIIILGIWHLVLFGFGLYRSKRLYRFWRIALEIVQAILLCAFIGFFCFKFFKWPYLSLRYLALFIVLSSLSLIAVRAVVRLFLTYARSKRR